MMTTDRLSSDDPILRDMIFRHERYWKPLPDGRCTAYPDPESGREPWTIGYGSTGEDIHEHTVWTREEAVARCGEDIASAITDLDVHKPSWRAHSLPRQRVLADMTYNMGIRRLMGFAHMWAALDRHDYNAAKAEMIDSDWARQTKTRAAELEQMMELG